MNKAQKRTWWNFVISFATLIISAVVITYIRRNEINIYDLSKLARLRILSLLMTIPLILMVILSVRFPKKGFDERDRKIDRKAVVCGSMGAFIFLAAAGWFLAVITKMGSIKAAWITLLVYLAAFVWFFISSVAALIQYGWRIKEKNHE